MKVIKKTDDYTILQKKSERYAVRAKGRKMINGEEKTRILVEHGLITVSKPSEKPAEPEAAEGDGEGEGADGASGSSEG